MSGMSSILSIALYPDVPSHHEPKIEKRELPLGMLLSRKAIPLSIPARCERSRRRHGGMPSMLLMPLMRMTPPFWMPAPTRRYGCLSSDTYGRGLRRAYANSGFTAARP